MTMLFLTGNDLEQRKHAESSHFSSVLSVNVHILKYTVLSLSLSISHTRTHTQMNTHTHTDA